MSAPVTVNCPLWMSNAPPVLFSVTWLIVLTPVPTVFLIVPALVTDSKLLSLPVMPLSLWMCNSAPAWFSSTCTLLFTVKLPVPVRLIVPPDWFVISRCSVTGPVTFSVAPEAITVCAAPPVIDPPDHVSALSTVSAPAPFSVPPEAISRVSAFIAAATVIVPPFTLNSPAPLMSAPVLNVCVPAVRFTCPLVPMLYVPLTVPPPESVNVLAEPTVTVPALLNALVRLKFRPFWIVKLPDDVLVANPASASVVPDVAL